MAYKAFISDLTWRNKTHQVLNISARCQIPPDELTIYAPEDLSALLRPTKRHENDIIAVSSLAVLADNEKEFVRILKLIRKKKMHIGDCEANVNYRWSLPVSHIVEQWKLARKQGAAKIGGKMSADKKKDNSALAVAKIKDRWPLPSKEWPTKALLKEAGISLNTAKAHLGKRPIAQYNYQAKLKRKAAKDAKR